MRVLTLVSLVILAMLSMSESEAATFQLENKKFGLCVGRFTGGEVGGVGCSTTNANLRAEDVQCEYSGIQITTFRCTMRLRFNTLAAGGVQQCVHATGQTALKRETCSGSDRQKFNTWGRVGLASSYWNTFYGTSRVLTMSTDRDIFLAPDTGFSYQRWQ